jgi:hypothetical protein
MVRELEILSYEKQLKYQLFLVYRPREDRITVFKNCVCHLEMELDMFYTM